MKDEKKEIMETIYQYRAEIDERYAASLLKANRLYARSASLPEELEEIRREVEKYRYGRTVLDNLEIRILSLHDKT